MAVRPTQSNTRRTALQTIATLAGSTVLAACGEEAASSGSDGPIDTSEQPEGRRLTVGSIALTADEELEFYQPFVDYLARRLQPLGITGGRVMISPTMVEMAEHLKAGTVDLYLDSPFPTVVVNALAGSQPWLRRWKKGVASYHSVIFVRKDSGLTTVDDLKGKMVAFKQAFSTSGYLLPRAALLQRGIALTEYADAADPVAPNRVGYVFSRDSESTLFWVLRQKVTAGALGNDAFDVLAESHRDDLQVLLQSVEVPRHVISHRAGLERPLLTALEEELLAMERDPEGQEVLEAFEKTAKFDHFPNGIDATFEPIRQLVQFIAADLQA